MVQVSTTQYKTALELTIIHKTHLYTIVPRSVKIRLSKEWLDDSSLLRTQGLKNDAIAGICSERTGPLWIKINAINIRESARRQNRSVRVTMIIDTLYHKTETN